MRLAGRGGHGNRPRGVLRADRSYHRPMPRASGDRRVLMLAYHFPPIGGAGVQRTTKFVRFLPDLGYLPVVVASPGAATDRFTPHDAGLMRGVPQAAEVHRVPGPEPPISRGWRRRAERWCGVPPPFGRWWTAGARELAVRVGADAGVDLVYATIMPFESGVAGVQVARALGRPLVVNLRDAWAIDELQVYPTAAHRRLEARRMRAVMGAADAVVMNTREAARRAVERFPELSGRRVLAIGNGFDGSEFAGPPPARTDAAFRIVHTGMLYTELGLRHERSTMARRVLRGASPDLNILGRSPVYLYRALDRLLAEDPSAAGRVQVHLAGVLSDADREVSAACAARVHLHPYLSHADSIDLIRSADLLFLPMHRPAPGVASSTMPGKAFEYMASGRPILAAVPPGDAHDLLSALGTARVCAPTDVNGMLRALREELARTDSGRPPPEPDAQVLARCERRARAAELAAVFDDVLAGRAGGRDRL